MMTSALYVGTAAPRILVAGVGNIFFGDDAFGVEVVQRYARRTPQPTVRVMDAGIRGLDLAYALLDPYEAVILIDAVPRGGSPGTLYVLEPDLTALDPQPPQLEAHTMDPLRVLRVAAAMGARLERVLLLGCEPAPISDDDLSPGLSEPVSRAVEEALPLLDTLLNTLLAPAAPAESPLHAKRFDMET